MILLLFHVYLNSYRLVPCQKPGWSTLCFIWFGFCSSRTEMPSWIGFRAWLRGFRTWHVLEITVRLPGRRRKSSPSRGRCFRQQYAYQQPGVCLSLVRDFLLLPVSARQKKRKRKQKFHSGKRSFETRENAVCKLTLSLVLLPFVKPFWFWNDSLLDLLLTNSKEGDVGAREKEKESPWFLAIVDKSLRHVASKDGKIPIKIFFK